MTTLIEQIASISLFNGLPADQVEALTMITVENSYLKGENIFSEDEQAKGFYVVLSGRVKVFKLSSEGREQILHIFGPGEVFGEVPVFAGKKFPASADVMEASRILFFPRDSLLRLIEKNPAIALNMLAVLSKRLRSFTSMIDDLSLREVPGRLAKHLLYLSEQKQNSHDLELNITKGQLASLLGTIPETLSRILTKMAEQGIIESDGRKIRILERDSVEELAEGVRRL
jgi:CRP-like cAMP-binding protein